MMGRIDVQRLNVPADFAAIFEQQAVVPAEPEKPAAVITPLVPETFAAATPANCSKCNSKLSGVEAKMGRCLTFGTTLNADSVKVGL
jgi:hypothetical protein